MIDLIANGFALRNKLSAENPQEIRSISATDMPCLVTIPAISAESAIASSENKYTNYYIESKNNSTADCADPADIQSSKETYIADNVRNSCGLRTKHNKTYNVIPLAQLKTTYGTQWSSLEMVTCNCCKHFTPDQIGDGVGIGECHLGVKWTNEAINGRVPLFRYAQRSCNYYNEFISQ